jgi:hypothetical protein
MKTFLKNLIQFLSIGLIPIIVFLISYLYFDPFHILKEYKDYSNPIVTPNRDFVSTTIYIKNHSQYNYNSFIFGSSRTLAFKPTSWQKYLSNSDSPFMFDASCESIYGIYKKLKFLESNKTKIDNALLIICRDHSFENSENHEGFLFIKHPATSNESKFTFHKVFFKAYLNPKFLYHFYKYKIDGSYHPSMEGVLENRKITFDSISNRMYIEGQEESIIQNPEKYYAQKKLFFYKQNGETTDTVQKIVGKHIFMLKKIKQILDKNQTKYKVILSPLYEQVKFHPSDLSFLKKQFGENLYDFSGKNSFTESKYNYYESSHYKTKIGDSIFKIIYKK